MLYKKMKHYLVHHVCKVKYLKTKPEIIYRNDNDKSFAQKIFKKTVMAK